MENTSKALIMAGGILISMIILSLLVMFFNNIKSLQATKQTVEASEQAVEFNKQFEEYYKDDIIGSEFLSLINRVLDYNATYVNDGYYDYEEMELTVSFSTRIPITINGENETIQANRSFSAQQLSNLFNRIEAQLNTYKDNINVDGNSINIIEASGLRTREDSSLGDSNNRIRNGRPVAHSELTKYIVSKGITDTDDNVNFIRERITEYLNLKSAFTQIKSTKFNAVPGSWGYSQNTGRIIRMVFAES